ncbi:MAG: hypothetical protein IT289_10885 [Oligoflexia bacterium]|nr:hypothetical protein [Oligoflexia bacterium]
MKVLIKNAQDLDWALNFHPRRPWPKPLPIVVGRNDLVVAGFDRPRDQVAVSILQIDEEPMALLNQLYDTNELAPLERLRFMKLSGAPIELNLEPWSLEFQNYLDNRNLGLRVLQPLDHLIDWKESLENTLMKLRLSASQCREAIDILADLKFLGRDRTSWQDLNTENPESWIRSLRQLRFPKTANQDQQRQQKLDSLPWPRGVQAKWDRQGDQGVLVLQSRIGGPDELKKALSRLQDMSLDKEMWEKQ